MNKPILTEASIKKQTALDENGNGNYLKGKCCPKCQQGSSFALRMTFTTFLTDWDITVKGVNIAAVQSHTPVTCNSNNCNWSGTFRDLAELDTETWPEFKEGDRVLSYAARQTSGWSYSWESSIYIAKQRRRDGVVTWRRDGDPFSQSKSERYAWNECVNKQRSILKDEGVKLLILKGIKRGTVILNSETVTAHLMEGG